MTRAALAALQQTLLTARTDLERQAALIGPEATAVVAAPVKALDYSLALVESDMVERDAAEEELVAALPRTRLALSERGRVLPDYEEVEA